MLGGLPTEERTATATGHISPFQPAGANRQIMFSVYHRQRISRAAPRQKRIGVKGPLRTRARECRPAVLAALLTLAACDAVQVVEGTDTHVSIRYDGMMNGLDRATQLARKFCAAHGKTAKLRKTYYEGLGAGERFGFFDCI
jgi:hypothetical protein